jgi:elongator complex protein 2
VGDAGANHLGYYTGAWSPSGDAIAAHGFTGALHTWARAEGARWAPRAAAGGHYAAVVDCCWAAGDGCLLTAGADQTARVTARLTSGRWCEVARPQVHGHDFACVAALPPRGGGAGGAAQYFYAAGSEEKVIRVLQAPQAFHDTLAMAQGGSSGGGGSGEPVAAAGAYGATLPALGLSNKAVYAGEDASAAAGAGPYDAGPDVAPSCAPSAVGGPPLEEHLAQNTLWPEAHKLYGHGNEVYCLAADPRGELLASAARAQSPADAAIWLWDAARWAPAGALDAHALTVTQLAFSPDGERLASASRDRSVGVFARRAAGAPAGAPPFALVGKLKAHARIVWALAWSPDSRLLATASRDGSLKVWAAGGEALPGAPLCALPMGDAVRSVAFAPAPPAGTGAVDPGSRTYLLAAGLESGVLCVLRLTWGPASGEAAAREVWRSSVFQQHAAAVRRVCWRAGEPAAGGGRRQQLLLASCGDDHSVRIFACSAPQDGGE